MGKHNKKHASPLQSPATEKPTNNTQIKNQKEDSNSSDDEDLDLDISQETLYDRLIALGDMFPQHKREKLVQFASDKAQSTFTVLKKVGSVAWIVTTSALVLVVPLIFEMERDMQWQAMEQEQLIQQKALVNGGGNAAAASNPLINAPIRQ